jgi:hypothetical protein
MSLFRYRLYENTAQHMIAGTHGNGGGGPLKDLSALVAE